MRLRFRVPRAYGAIRQPPIGVNLREDRNREWTRIDAKVGAYLADDWSNFALVRVHSRFLSSLRLTRKGSRRTRPWREAQKERGPRAASRVSTRARSSAMSVPLRFCVRFFFASLRLFRKGLAGGAVHAPAPNSKSRSGQS